jgi:hypothetical protein
MKFTAGMNGIRTSSDLTRVLRPRVGYRLAGGSRPPYAGAAVTSCVLAAASRMYSERTRPVGQATASQIGEPASQLT